MFRKAYRLPFTLLGIPVLLDVTFLIILPLFAFSIAARVGYWAQQVGVEDHPALHRPWVPYLLGLVTALGLFASVVLHELGHSVVARMYGVKVRSITLWLLGGVAQFDEMPRQRGAEAVMAIAGPLVSVAVGALCWLVLRALPTSAVPARFVFHYLAFMNVALAVFNMIPALPLDGGRVLRSLLALRMPHLRATQVAAGISKGLAILMGLFGLFFGGGIWFLVLAFFIYMAVNSELRGSMVTELLEGARVGELMTRRVTPVSADLSVAELAQAMMREHVQGFPVVDNGGRVIGMVCIEDLQGKQVPPDARVADVMRPQVYAIRPEAPAVEAMQRMSSNNYPRLLVVDATGQVVGVLTNTDLLRAIEMRTMGLRWGVPAGDGDGSPPQVVLGPQPSVADRN
jgi:Zn-dependent protease/predicted transcriptional regulator